MTDPMTPETPYPPPVSPDPWDAVDGEFLDSVHGWFTFYRKADVDAARAADALRHQQEIAAKDEWIDIVTRGKSPCGHWSAYTFTADGGKNIACLACERAELRAALSTAEAEITRLSWNLDATTRERDDVQRQFDKACVDLSTAEAPIQQQAESYQRVIEAEYAKREALEATIASLTAQVEAERDAHAVTRMAHVGALNAQREQQERQKHDANCELRGPGGAVDRRCSCGFRALRAELASLRAERDAAQQEKAKAIEILNNDIVYMGEINKKIQQRLDYWNCSECGWHHAVDCSHKMEAQTLREALTQARLQLEYLDGRFQSTGTTAGVLAQIASALSSSPRPQEPGGHQP